MRSQHKSSRERDLRASVEYLRQRGGQSSALGLVLGSGYGEVLEALEETVRIAYADIPGFPQATVPGHHGCLIAGKLEGTPLLALSGRAHFYEGHEMEAVTFPIRVLAALGIRDLLLTNAAGGINSRFRPGDFMTVTDHINFMGTNPLRGPVAAGRERFVDLSQTYDPDLTRLLKRAAKKAGIQLRQGVYLAVSGPSYETPAEIRAFRRLGADAVGMSTVPEVIVARQCGLRVAALSCITNAAAGMARKPICHEEVLAQLNHVTNRAAKLLRAFAALHADFAR